MQSVPSIRQRYLPSGIGVRRTFRFAIMRAEWTFRPTVGKGGLDAAPVVGVSYGLEPLLDFRMLRTAEHGVRPSPTLACRNGGRWPAQDRP